MIIGEFCDVYPPEIDGVGVVVRNYVEQLNLKGHDCYYIAPKPNKKNAQLFENDSLNVINHFSIPMMNEAYRFGLPDFDIKYRREMSSVDFNIVHAHSPFSAGQNAVKFAKKLNIPLVGTFHSKYYDDFYSKTHNEMLAELGTKYVISFYNKCDEVWTVGPATADTLREYGYKGEIFIVPNGTDIYKYDEQRISEVERRFSFGKENIFLFVGQHNFKKNVKYIIEALAIYRKSHDNFKMIFVGQGLDAEKMKEMVRNLGIADKTIFAGQIMDRSLLMAIYAKADLFIFPSLYDTGSLVLREAASAGTPSIICRDSSIAEVVKDNENGFLCENTPEDIAKRIESALPQANEVGQNARNTIPIPWEKVTDIAYERYYNLIIKMNKQLKFKI